MKTEQPPKPHHPSSPVSPVRGKQEAIRKNFILVYELLDETLDYGYPQGTSTETLKNHVRNEPILVDSVKSMRLPSVRERGGRGGRGGGRTVTVAKPKSPHSAPRTSKVDCAGGPFRCGRAEARWALVEDAWTLFTPGRGTTEVGRRLYERCLLFFCHATSSFFLALLLTLVWESHGVEAISRKRESPGRTRRGFAESRSGRS